MTKEELHPLVELGLKKFYSDDSQAHNLTFVEDQEANKLLNDIKNYPHAYVLACCMDRQIKAERAWKIPYDIKQNICPSFSIDDLAKISLETYIKTFNERNLHRFNDTMAKVFYSAVQKIKIDYGGDANKIWDGKPSSSAVVYRFLEFEGVGVKIATMASNLLARLYKKPFSDYYSIDVSPDVHVKRVMYRLGLIDDEDSIDKVIYKARELYPEFPGIIDDPLWEIGRNICRNTNPNCTECNLKQVCKYYRDNKG